MALPKNVVYRFVDDPRSDEVEMDLPGALTFKKGDVLKRGEKQWRVNRIQWELPGKESKQVPTLWVFLVNAWVN
jgi:hypothetical protein